MAGEDHFYIAWLGGKECSSRCGRRSGPPHHPRHNVGLAMRAHDHRAVPLCPECHESIHRLTFGFFKGWNRQQVRYWLDALAVKYRALYENLNKE
jgi:hypothetical protein